MGSIHPRNPPFAALLARRCPGYVRAMVSPAPTGRRILAGLSIGLLVLCAAFLATDSSERAGADVPDVALTSLGTFASPLYVTSPPGDPGRIFVVEREGTVRVVKNGVVLPTPFIDVSDEIGGGGERGLLSIAFAPDYAVSGLVYAFATQPNGTLVVWEFLAAPGADVANAGHRTVLSIPHSAPNHNGGQLQFGPDGYLYIGVGDNANCQQRPEHDRPARQDPAHRPARRRSATPSRRASRSRPESRPRSTPTASAIPGASRSTRSRATCSSPTSATAAGRRSTSCRPATRRARTSDGRAGRARMRSGGSNCTAPGALPPIFEYAHDATHCSITGGYIARDPTVPTLAGRYLFADYCGAGHERPARAGRLAARHRGARCGAAHRRLRGRLRRPPLHHVAGRRRMAHHGHGRGRQAARRELHALDHDACGRRERPPRRVELDRSGRPDRQLLLGRRRRRQGRRQGRHVRRQLSDGRRAADHAHGRRCGRRALVAHPGRVRRRQGGGRHGFRAQGDAVGARPPEARGRPQARPARALPQQHRCHLADHGHDAQGREAARHAPAACRRDVSRGGRSRHARAAARCACPSRLPA